jgi:hypothetical protein
MVVIDHFMTETGQVAEVVLGVELTAGGDLRSKANDFGDLASGAFVAMVFEIGNLTDSFS